MKVSIIVPLYNVESYIGGCLQSVANQTCNAEIECIIVDDCGTDNSLAITEDFVRHYSGNVNFIILHHENNRGLSASRNTGIAASTGEYLFFLDSDDTMSDDCIDKMLDAMQSSGCDVVCAQHICINERKHIIQTAQCQTREGLITDRNDIINAYHISWNVNAWNKLLSKRYLIENKLFFEDGIVREDELWSFKVACTAQSMYFLLENTYNHLINRPGSIMNNNQLGYHIECMKKVIEKETEIVIEKQLTGSLHLYNIIEDAKRRNLSSAHWIYDSESLKSDYRFYRSLKFKTIFSFPFCGIRWFQYLIRDFHYLLPENLGYYWLNMLNLFVLKKNILLNKLKK